MGLKKGIVPIHGKQYKTVALRVDEFRSSFSGYGMDTQIIDAGIESGHAVISAKIYNPEGRIIASGYATEKWGSSKINTTSALENCETSAIGRALANLGLGGEEYASADELISALEQQNQNNKTPPSKKNLRDNRSSNVNVTYLNSIKDEFKRVFEEIRVVVGDDSALEMCGLDPKKPKESLTEISMMDNNKLSSLTDELKLKCHWINDKKT